VLRGRVVDERGYGVPDAAITARALGRNLAQVVLGGTAGDGSFALDGVGRGPYHVTAEVDGAVRAQVIGATAERESVLVLGEPIARAALAGGDTVIDPGLGPGLVEPSAFDGEAYPADPSGGDSLGVVAITERQDPAAAGAQTAGSYDTPYGQADQLVVTGPPSGPGGLPISLGPGASGGVFVRAVQPGSQVAGAGLAAGDRVVAVDGAPIKSVAQAKAAIAGRIGTVVMLEVVHEGEHINVVVQRVRVPQ